MKFDVTFSFVCVQTYWKQVKFVKAFSASHAILLEELKNLSTTINQTIDLTGLISNHSEPANVEPSQVSDKIPNYPEVVPLSMLFTCLHK